MSSQFTTAIAVPAGGRPEVLDRLLGILADEYGARPGVELVVADNSAEATGRPVFERFRSRFGAARYAHEPQRGYSNVRNAILAQLGEVDAIAMIDDDEVPEPGWLDRLIAAQERTGADVVAGPVVSELPAGSPRRFAESGVFDMEAPPFAEGEEMRWCASNNTLVLARVLDLVPDGFDPRLNRTGGTDTDYFLRARLAGCKIVWTNAAVVREVLPRKRLTRRWIFRRAVRAGNTRALTEFRLVGGVRVKAARAAKAVGLLGVGVATVAAATARRDQGMALRGLHRVGLFWGMALAFVRPEPWAA